MLASRARCVTGAASSVSEKPFVPPFLMTSCDFLRLTAVAVLGIATCTSALVAQQPDSASVAHVVVAYHDAMRKGDSAAVLALMTEDVVVLESGGAETREQFRAHHLPADIRFAQAIESKRGPIAVRIKGDVAWASSTSTSQGDYNGRAINSSGAELMVLTRTPQGWRIAAIHWSSRQRRAQ